jgi:hypothetical protein
MLERELAGWTAAIRPDPSCSLRMNHNGPADSRSAESPAEAIAVTSAKPPADARLRAREG